MTTPILEARGLTLGYRRDVAVARDVSFALAEGESLALVGESGSGKTTILRAVAGLIAPQKGEVRLAGRLFAPLSERRRRPMRRDLQMVFQDPTEALDPRQRAAAIVAEPLTVHEPTLHRSRRRDRVLDALREVGLDAEHLDRHPHELSGGQKQRVGLARALIVRPRVLLLDEAVSALDVSAQAQVLNLLAALRLRHGLAFLLVSHDFAVVRRLADRVLVLDSGAIVEEGGVESILSRPRHPRTAALVAAARAGTTVAGRL